MERKPLMKPVMIITTSKVMDAPLHARSKLVSTVLEIILHPALQFVGITLLLQTKVVTMVTQIH